MGDHALLVYPPHGQGATGDVDNAETFAFDGIKTSFVFWIKSETLRLSDIYKLQNKTKTCK